MLFLSISDRTRAYILGPQESNDDNQKSDYRWRRGDLLHGFLGSGKKACNYWVTCGSPSSLTRNWAGEYRSDAHGWLDWTSVYFGRQWAGAQSAVAWWRWNTDSCQCHPGHRKIWRHFLPSFDHDPTNNRQQFSLHCWFFRIPGFG